MCATKRLLLATSALLIYTPTLRAQQLPSVSPKATDDRGRSDIVVTARNRRERLADVPIAITTFNAGQISRQKIETFADVARMDSSLVFDRGSGLQDTRPVIRGLPSSRGRPPVGILIDGVDASTESMGASAGGSTLLNTRAIEIDRIEVVKGPQSALYGRVAFGGAVNYVTKKPSNKFGGELDAEVGDYGTYEGRAALTGPLADGLSARIHGYYSTFGGFYRNQASGARIGGFESYGGGGSLLFDRGSGNALLTVNYSHDHIAPAAQEYAGAVVVPNVTISLVPGVAGAQVGTIGHTNPLPSTIRAIPFGTITDPGTGVRLSLDPRTGKDYPGAVVKTFRAGLTLNFALGDHAKLTSITSLTQSRFNEREDIDFYAFPQATVPGPGGPGNAENFNRFFELNIFGGKVKQFNQEIRLGNLEGGPLRWAVGGLVWNEKYQQNNESAAYVVPVGMSGQKDVTLVQNNLPYAYGSRKTNHISGYGLLDYDFTKQLTLSVEARYAHESYDYVFSPFLTTSQTPLPNGGYPVVVLAQPTPTSSKTNYFAPKASVRFKPTDNLMVYVSAAKGIKPAGYSTVAVFDSSMASYDVEKLYNYETGIKASFLDRRVFFDSAFFYMQYKGKQISIAQPNPLTPSGFSNFIRNAGSARVYGLETSLTVVPVRNLTINAGYTYLDAKYSDYQVNVNSALIGSFVSSCVPNTIIGNGVFCRANLRGNRLERTPKHSITGSARYSLPLAGGQDVFVEGDVRYTSNRAVDEYNRRFIPPYTTANVRVGFDRGSLTLLAYVDNVFNSKAIEGAVAVGDQNNPGNFANILQLPDKRHIGVRASYKF